MKNKSNDNGPADSLFQNMRENRFNLYLHPRRNEVFSYQNVSVVYDNVPHSKFDHLVF